MHLLTSGGVFRSVPLPVLLATEVYYKVQYQLTKDDYQE